MTKVKKYACKVWNGLDIIMKDNMNIFECQYKEINSIKNGGNK